MKDLCTLPLIVMMRDQRPHSCTHLKQFKNGQNTQTTVLRYWTVGSETIISIESKKKKA